MNNEKSLYEFLINHKNKKAISFHMPGHKGSALYKRFGYEDFLTGFMDMDITEIPGADNLFQREGVLKSCSERYQHLYGAGSSYPLINGTSGGLIACILASVPFGGKIIMARNSHKSIFNALRLGNIKPVYSYPVLTKEFGISGEIPSHEIQKLLEENPDASAVVLPSPNYYGICSDVAAISKLVHEYGKTLIIDEAHGAHLHFFKNHLTEYPKDALSNGADMVVNSIHKTLPSMTQSALLNINKAAKNVDLDILSDKLQMIQSTSPSYVLMASLDIAASLLEDHGEILFNEWDSNLNTFYQNLSEIEGLDVISSYKLESAAACCGLDRTKINFSMRNLEISGLDLEKILIEKYNIYTELTSGDLVMAMSGVGNTESDFSRLSSALSEIAENRRLEISNLKGDNGISHLHSYVCPLPPIPTEPVLLKEVPIYKHKEKLEDCCGKVCALSIIPYPPGIPILCPGEVITKSLITYISDLRKLGEKVIGVTESGEIFVG